MNRLQKKYNEEIVSKIKKDFKISNVMKVSRLKKISLNSGIGGFRENRDMVESFVHELSDIAGQKPYVRKAKSSEAGFKIRKNEVVAYALTLRGNQMWAFLDKLINVALPRVRDFRGLSLDSFDDNGNYTIGIKEHVIFPEVNPNTVKGIRGLQITLTMSSGDIEVNKAILNELGMPFKKDKNNG